MTNKSGLSFFGGHSAILVLYVIMAAVVLPASATVYTIDPGDSVQAAIDGAVSGDTIVLNPGTYSGNGMTITAKDLTFRAADGHGPTDTIIDGMSAAPRIITVTDASSLNIENLNLRNGRAGNGGPGSEGSWTTDGGTGGTGKSGGAISSKGPVTIASSSITSCKAGNGGNGGDSGWLSGDGGYGGDGGSGGAIYTTGIVTLTSSIITDCSAGNGGNKGDAIGIGGDDGGGGSGGHGGAVYSTGTVTLTSSLVASCGSGDGGNGDNIDAGGNAGDGGNGGAIYAEGTATVISSTIKDSSAGSGGMGGRNGGAGGSGGGIWGPGVALTSSTMSNCLAGNGGSDGGVSGTGGNGGSGGAVYSPSSVTLTSSAISGSSAGNGAHGSENADHSIGGDGGNGGSGGAICAASTVTLTSSTIHGCKAGTHGIGGPGDWSDGHNGIGGNGGAIFTKTSATVTDSTFTICLTERDGGAIFADTGSATMDTSIFATCVAGRNGGAVRSFNQAAITDSTFMTCVAGSKGGAIYSEYGVTATSSTIENCIAPNGGAVYGRGGPITFCRLVNNDAEGPAVSSPKGSFDAAYNWWGDNSDPSGQVGADVSCSPWLVLGINATPPPLTSQDYIVTADLTYDSDGVRHDPALGHLPDGIPVSYAVESGSGTGSVSPASAGTMSGMSQTAFTSTQAGTANVTATVDGQTVSACIERPIAGFTADDLSVVRQKQAAVFTVQTISSLPLTCLWDFGDGSTSTEENPDHIYQKEDVYAVTLTISNALGHDTITQEDYLFATRPNPLKANFMGANKTGENPLEVQFADHSLVSVKVPSYPAIDTWLWDFGDGNTSTEQHPTHIYQDAGRYSVTLTVGNGVDNDTKTKDFITATKDIKVTKKISTGLESPDNGETDPSLQPLPEPPGKSDDEQEEGDGVVPESSKGNSHNSLKNPKKPKDDKAGNASDHSVDKKDKEA